MTTLLWLVGLPLLLGLLVAWRFLQPAAEPLPGPLASLKSHFDANGLPTEVTLVRTALKAEARKHARWGVKAAGERPIYVYWCQSPAAAQAVLEQFRKAPTPNLAAAKGELVIYLTEWPATDPLGQRILAVFQSWPGT